MRIPADRNQSISADMHRLTDYWYDVGWPAFIAMLDILYVMVFKPLLA